MAHQHQLDPEAHKGIPRDPRVSDPEKRREMLTGLADGTLIPGMIPQGLVTQALAAEVMSKKKKGKGNRPAVSGKPPV